MISASASDPNSPVTPLSKHLRAMSPYAIALVIQDRRSVLMQLGFIKVLQGHFRDTAPG
jgi:hypothetical protein